MFPTLRYGPYLILLPPQSRAERRGALFQDAAAVLAVHVGVRGAAVHPVGLHEAPGDGRPAAGQLHDWPGRRGSRQRRQGRVALSSSLDKLWALKLKSIEIGQNDPLYMVSPK